MSAQPTIEGPALDTTSGPPPPRVVAVFPSADAPREGPPPARPVAELPYLATAHIKLEGEWLTLDVKNEEIADIVASIYQLSGRPQLQAIADQLYQQRDQLYQQRDHPSDLEASRATLVAEVWHAERMRFDGTIRRWLIDVEDRATAITLARLRRSRADVLEEASRYLLGLPPNDPGDRGLKFGSVRLAEATPAVLELRRFLQEVSRLRLAARDALKRYYRATDPNSLIHTQYGRPDPTRVDAGRRAYLDALARLQRFVAEAARRSPLLYWVVDPSVDPVVDVTKAGGTAEELRARIVKILRRCWDASWTVQDRINAMPARTGVCTRPGNRGPEEQLADSLDDVEEAGPWRFTSVVAQALDELGWTDPSPQAVAVTRTYAEAGPLWAASLAYSVGSFAALAMVHAFCPPAGLIVDVGLTAWGVVRAALELSEQRVEFEAILDQEQSLSVDLDVRPLVAETIGFFAAPVSGAAGLVLGLLPLAVYAWPVDGPAQP